MNALKFQILIFSLLVWLSYLSKEYFVCLNGSESYRGSKNLPLKTIFIAFELAMPGNTVAVLGGNYPLSNPFYPQRSGTPDQWILYRGVPNEEVIFDGKQIKKILQKGDSVQFSRQAIGLF